MTRRDFLTRTTTLSAAALAGCTRQPVRTAAAPATPMLPFYDKVPPLVPIRAEVDRLCRITVCTRPFRAQGPRIEAETIGDKLIVHNYGHGGSGWSLSWGSGTLALELALAGRDPSQTDLAVIGCGALGLTSAILAQRAGARSVTIYSKDRTSETRSFNATGSWTPDSRVAFTAAAPPSFAAQWERMTRTSWHYYQSFLGLPGTPVEFSDRYYLSDPHPAVAERQKRSQLAELGFAFYSDRIPDIVPAAEDLPAGSHPFPTQWARRRSEMLFNITAYVHQLTEDFQLNGGTIIHREFHSPAEFAALPQPVILHSTGYAARALFSDASLTPVRGQIGWLIPQPEVNYGLYYQGLNILGRRDGIVIQPSPQGEATGFNDPSETPDRAVAEAGIRQLQALYARMSPSLT
jgi:D-amino-acid oxidase